MKESILSIEEATFQHEKSHYDGYIIVTDNQTIKMGISNGQQCCENWGYLITNDMIQEFIGSNLLSVTVVDDLLMPVNIDALNEGSVMFINIETDNGTLQFVAYNEHNGYYSHNAVFISRDLNVSECL